MITVKTFVPGHYLHTTISTHYTVPNNTKAIVHNAVVANSASSNAHTFTIHVIDTGSSQDTTNVVISSRTLAPLETYKCPELVGMTLTSTGTFRAICSSTSTLAFRVSGVEVT